PSTTLFRSCLRPRRRRHHITRARAIRRVHWVQSPARRRTRQHHRHETLHRKDAPMSYTTSDRVTPIRRGPTPPPPLDPTVTTQWQSAPAIAPAPSERDRILAEIEMDGILHEIRQDELRRAEYAAALDELRSLVGDHVLYAKPPESTVDLSDLPDPRAVLARKQGRTLRLPPAASKKDAAALRKEQLKRRGRSTVASGNPRDLARPVDPLVAQLNDAYAEGRISYLEWRDRVN